MKTCLLVVLATIALVANGQPKVSGAQCDREGKCVPESRLCKKLENVDDCAQGMKCCQVRRMFKANGENGQGNRPNNGPNNSKEGGRYGKCSKSTSCEGRCRPECKGNSIATSSSCGDGCVCCVKTEKKKKKCTNTSCSGKCKKRCNGKFTPSSGVCGNGCVCCERSSSKNKCPGFCKRSPSCGSSSSDDCTCCTKQKKCTNKGGRVISGSCQNNVCCYFDAPGSTSPAVPPCDYSTFTSDHSALKDPTCTNVKPALTEAEKTQILSKHNTLRAKVANGDETQGSPGPQPSGTNIRELVWNEELALVAQAWASQCTFAHDCFDCRKICSRSYAVGQNVYTAWTSVTGETSILWDAVIQAWYDEVEFMPNTLVSAFGDPGNGQVIGHYTQVVWADTYEIGCGAVHFADSGTRKLYVCNYGPTGNYLTLPVYEQGPAASNCPTTASTTYPGLCN